MSNEITFQYYVVGLIDFLNQGNQLEGLNRIPESDEEKQEFRNRAKQTVGVVDLFRNAFRDFFEKCTGGPRSALRELLNEQDRLDYDRFRALEIRCQHFSDTTVIFSPLVNQEGALTPLGVHSMLIAAGSTLLSALAEGVALRGGIEVGVGVEFWPNEVYGPVLRHAYKLESAVAEYPRIVLGSRLMAFIRHLAEGRESDRLSALNCAVATACKSLICIDHDGLPLVDFLGTAFRSFAAGLQYEALIERAYSFVEAEHRRFMRETNQKLALRYFRLHQYFLARMNAKR